MKKWVKDPNTGEWKRVEEEDADLSPEEQERRKASESFKRSVGTNQSSFKKLKRMITGE